MKKRFPLAPMSPVILVLTLVLWLLPFLFAGHYAFTGNVIAGMTAFFLVFLYGLVWACCRPSRFEVSPVGLAIQFPAWTRRVPVQTIKSVSRLNAREFKERYGWAIRIGAGGLWGGFGWLRTAKGGLVEFYVSRTDGLVMVQRKWGRHILLTPEDPAAFAAVLAESLRQ